MDRKLELIQAACSMIAEKGFEGLRIRDVASQVGINPATMYYYFPTKEAMIAGVVVYVFGCLRIIPEETPGTPREQLHSYLIRLVRQMRDAPGLFSVFAEIQLRASRSSIAQLYLEQEALWHKKLTGLIQTGIRQGYWPNYMDPEQAATSIILILQGASLQAAVNPRNIENSITQLERWLTGR